MSNGIPEIDEVMSISDPGEKNRENHTWGDRLTVNVSNVIAWVLPLLMVAIVAQVIMRKAGFNQAWLDDAQWWMYGFAMLAGFAYAITTESHVRVDILHQNYSPVRKARIEVFAHGWLLLPFMALMTVMLFHYALVSIKVGEGSDSPNGLHMLYLLKTSLPILFSLAIIASWSAMSRHLRTIGTPSLFAKLIGAFPFVWFVAERTIFYVLYWLIRVTNPDLNPRRIIRDPLVEYTIYMGLALTLILLLVAYLLKRSVKKG